MEFNEETSAQGGGMERDGPARARRMPVSEVAALLRNDAAAVARALLGEPNKQLSTRAKLRFGSKGSLEVVVSGPKRGVWHDREANGGGDMLKLVQREQGSKSTGLEWARRRVGDHAAGSAPAVRNARPVRDTSAVDAAQEEVENAKKRVEACSYWDEAQPIEGTQAAAYLAARLPGADVLGMLRPDALRFLPRHKHDGTGRFFPVMVAKVAATPGGDLLAVHRTYLHPDPELPAQKAPVEPDRTFRGSPKGGGAWLTEVQPRMVIGEGIETTLSGLAALVGAGWGSAAALNTAGLKNLMLPPHVREVCILVDVDKLDRFGKQAGEVHARAAAARWAADGRTVTLAFPGPADGPPCDFNDLWREGGAGAVLAAIEGAEAIADPAKAEGERLIAELLARRSKIDAAGDLVPHNIRTGIEAGPLPNPLPLDAAQTKVQDVVRDWVWAAARSVASAPGAVPRMAKLHARQDVATLARDDPRRHGAARGAFLRERLRQHTADMATRLHGAGWNEPGDMPAPLLLAATVGLGKSRAAMAVVKDVVHEAPVKVPVVWLVPYYELAEQAAAAFRDLEVPAVVLKGRKKKGEDGEPLCGRADIAAQVAALGQSVRATLCEHKGKVCPLRTSCGYYRQAQAIAPGTVIIATHDALRTGTLPGGVTLAGRVVCKTACKTFQIPGVNSVQ